MGGSPVKDGTCVDTGLTTATGPQIVLRRRLYNGALLPNFILVFNISTYHPFTHYNFLIFPDTMPRLSVYLPGPDTFLEDNPFQTNTLAYEVLIEIIAANDVEALNEYIEEHTLDVKHPSRRGDIYKAAIWNGGVEVYDWLVTYQKAQAAVAAIRNCAIGSTTRA